MKDIINSVKSNYYRIAKELSAPKRFIQFAKTPRHDGSPHIEYEGDEFLYVFTERGYRYKEERTKDSNELLYWLVSDLTWGMAMEYELKHRIESENFRKQMFAKHIELLMSVNQDWGKRKKEEYDKLLIESPYEEKKIDHEHS